MARGGAREGAGRKGGVPNKATASVRDAAQAFTNDALETLASIMRNEKEPAAARVAAANAILDRGHGKPKQSVEASGPGGEPIKTESVTRLDVSDLTTEQLRALASINLGPPS